MDKSIRAHLLRELFQEFCDFVSPTWAGCRSQSSPTDSAEEAKNSKGFPPSFLHRARLAIEAGRLIY